MHANSDDPLIWKGNATLIHELAESGLRPDAVVLSVGGGGLLCGVVEGVKAVGWESVPVFAVETTLWWLYFSFHFVICSFIVLKLTCSYMAPLSPGVQVSNLILIFRIHPGH